MKWKLVLQNLNAKMINKIQRESNSFKKFLEVKNKKSKAMFPETRQCFGQPSEVLFRDLPTPVDGLPSRDDESHLPACNR